jgi:hypothetical protein
MSLHNLIGHSPSAEAEPVGSSLHGLVLPAVATVIERPAAMSLPAALNAVRRGQIDVHVQGADDGLSGLVDAPLPTIRPAPAPAPDWRDDPIFVEQRVQNEINRREMAARVSAKRLSARDQRQLARLAEAERQLVDQA